MAPLTEPDCRGRYPFTRRFAVRQPSSKGGVKLRCIDDFLDSQVNGVMRVEGRISMGKLSNLIASAKVLVSSEKGIGHDLDIIKSDFKAAYRSCPIATEDLDLTRIVVWDVKSQRYRETRHFCMPFGALSAVYSWDRLGQCLQAIVAGVLCAPVNRYVDDLYLVCYRQGSRELRAFMLELIDLLGFCLETSKTPTPAPSQTILGVHVEVSRNKIRGVHHYKAGLSLDESKAKCWYQQLCEAESSSVISCRDAQKLAGRFNFVAQAVL